MSGEITVEKEYWHEAVDTAKLEEMQEAGMTWAEANERYKPPPWCAYPDPLNALGCWSLIQCRVNSAEYCKGCDLYLDGDSPGPKETIEK